MGWAALAGCRGGGWRAMDVCGNCGRTREQGTTFCTGCGCRFADDNPQPTRSDNPFGPPGPSRPADSPAPSASQEFAGYYAPTGTFLAEGSREPAQSQEDAGSQGLPDPRGPAGPWPPGGGYGPPPPGRPFVPAGPGPSHRSRRSSAGFTGLTFRPAVLATVVVLIAAAAAASGAVLYLRHHPSHAEAARNPAQSTQPAQGAPRPARIPPPPGRAVPRRRRARRIPRRIPPGRAR